MPRVLALLVLAAAAALATPARAQAVRVRVLDDRTHAPVAGALVSLKRAGVRTLERLTNGDGERLLTAPADTGYTIEVRRVGFPVFVSPAFAVSGADTQSLELRVPASRTALAPAPLSRPTCRMGDAGLAGAGELWEQLRTALVSSEIARAEALEPLAIRRYERTLGRDGDVRSESPLEAASLGTRLFGTDAPEVLSRTGFSFVDAMGLPRFHAPDAAVLLSEAFAKDHCFRPVTGAGPTSGMIGLRFEPAPGRRVIDVEGALWADTATSELRLAEFAYRFPTPSDAQGTGGRIRFEQLSSATWIAREWEVRTPVLTQRGHLLGYHEEGGEALLVSRRMLFVMDSVANSRKPPGLITGVVDDSLTGDGFAAANVWLDSAGVRSKTDAKGVFFLRGVAPGRHVVRFSHPLLDSLGVWPRAADVTVASEAMADVKLAGPSLATLKGGACHDSLAVVAGLVRDAATGAPVDSADVTLTWIEIQLGADRRPQRISQRATIARTDSLGRYGACVTAGLEITAFAQRGVSRSGRVDLATERRRLGVQHLWLDLSTVDSLKGDAELRGFVRFQDGSPLRNASVTLSDPEVATTTDTLGRFRLAGIPGGTRVIDARALGHAPMRLVAELKPHEPSEVTVYLRRVTLLDPVIVRAAADGRAAETRAQLAEREKRRQGDRVTENKLRAFRGQYLEAVFRSLPYARVATVAAQPNNRLTLLDARSGECAPSVWLDGRRSTDAIVMGVRAADVLSIEVMRMRGQVPIEYQEFSDCGAVLVWMRPATVGK